MAEAGGGGGAHERGGREVTVVTMEIRMEYGEPQAVKEIAAAELEQILRKIGWARVRCLSAVEIPEEQMTMGGRR